MPISLVLVVAVASFFMVMYPEAEPTWLATAAVGCDGSGILKQKMESNIDGKYNKYAPIIDQAAAKYLSGVNGPALIAAVITVESNWIEGNPSSAGAIGLMQILPVEVAAAGADCMNAGIISSNADLDDPYKNIMCGAFYLKSLMNICQSPESALTAYLTGSCGYSSYATDVLKY